MNKLVKFFFIILYFNRTQTMEETEISDRVAQNENLINYFQKLPTELNEIIAKFLVSSNTSSEDQIKTIIFNLKNLCFSNREFYCIINSERFAKYLILALSNSAKAKALKIALLFNTPGACQWLKNESKINIEFKKLINRYRMKERAGKALITSQTINQKDLKTSLKNIIERNKINNLYSNNFTDKDLEYIIHSERFAKYVIVTVNKLINIDPITIALNLPTTGAAQWLKTKSQGNFILKNLINNHLLEAIKNREIDKVIHMLNAGASANIKDETGTTILMLASNSVFSKDAKIVAVLLQANADPNVTNNNGETALILASLKQNIKVVEELLKANANPSIKDRNGNTALNYASTNSTKSRNQRVLINMLKKAGAQGRVELAIANLSLNGLQIRRKNVF